MPGIVGAALAGMSTTCRYSGPRDTPASCAHCELRSPQDHAISLHGDNWSTAGAGAIGRRYNALVG